MKKIAFLSALMMFLLMTVGASAQEEEQLTAVRVKKGEMPQDVVDAVKRDFPNLNITGMEITPPDLYRKEWVIQESGKVNPAETEYYTVDMNGKEFHANAVYNKSGKLMFYREIRKDAPLPEAVRKTIGSDFPGWAIYGDNEVVKNERKEITYYRVKIKNGKEKMHLYVDPSGKLLQKNKIEKEEKKQSEKKS